VLVIKQVCPTADAISWPLGRESTGEKQQLIINEEASLHTTLKKALPG
jgi:hypothetical protein